MTAIEIGRRLRCARERLGWTQSEAGERTGIAHSAISEFENGKRSPSLFQLNSLGKAYRRDLSFFLDEGEPGREVVLWRGKPSEAKAKEFSSRLNWLAESYHMLERINGERPPQRLLQVSGDPAEYSLRDAESLAMQVRSVFKLGDQPAWTLLRTLEENFRVKIFHSDELPEESAACTLHETYGASVLLNAKHVRWRRNFDLAHELFHLLTWNLFRAGQAEDGVEASQREEELADCFAGQLLMPTEPLKQMVNEILGSRTSLTYDDIHEIARRFDVSATAVVHQVMIVYSIPKEEAARIREKISGATELSYRHPSETPQLLPDRYKTLAIRGHYRGLISTGKYAEYMQIERARAMQEPVGGEEPDVEINIGSC